MRNALQAFFQKPTTKIGIATAILFQLIFSVVWMTGYSGVTDRTSRLQVVLVNEDGGMGVQLAGQLRQSLPFRVVEESSIDATQSLLNSRKAHMVLQIPADFSKRLQTPGEKGELRYWINESNPALIKSIMLGVSGSITESANRHASAAGTAALLVQMNAPAAQAQAMAQGLSDKVAANVQSVNPVHGMNNQMVPMVLVLASYVGSMIMSMNLQQSSVLIGSQVSRWRKFAARGILNAGAAVCTSLVGTSLVLLLGGQTASGFLTLWGFQTLCLLGFLFFSQLFLLLLGNAGMLFNIIFLSVQLVSSGALVPRELLSGFYRGLGDALPATYAVEGMMNLLFGGPGIGPTALGLVAIIVASIAVGLAITAFRKEKETGIGAPSAPSLAR